MGHADGICHCYVDEEFDLDMAVRIVVDSKTQYVAVCNATETLLVHEGAASRYLPVLKAALDEKHVEIAGCPKTREIISVSPATEADWKTEYLDYKLSLRVVVILKDQPYQPLRLRPWDNIITTSRDKAARFISLVDSGNVFWNCSTRFSDGFRYGLGAEVGISTSKIHARGPVGLDGLVIYKYILLGNGQTVAEYAGRDKTFKHRKMVKTYSI